MKEYVLLFRMDITTKSAQPTGEQMQEHMINWTKWIEEIASKGRLAAGGNHFAKQGKLLLPGNKMTDGPYIANNESVAGYIIMMADTMEEAVQIARKCPILQGAGTSVEVRETTMPG